MPVQISELRRIEFASLDTLDEGFPFRGVDSDLLPTIRCLTDDDFPPVLTHLHARADTTERGPREPILRQDRVLLGFQQAHSLSLFRGWNSGHPLPLNTY